MQAENRKNGIIRRIPQERIAGKLDEYASKKDYGGLERLLHYWLSEARSGNDGEGQLFIYNELIGHHRKNGEKEAAFRYVEDALKLLSELRLDEIIAEGTTYINAATAYNAFGETGKALPLFRKAREIYEANSETPPQLLGGLYNNMAMTCQKAGELEEAFALYEQAMAVMEKVPGSAPERAITCMNMADAVEARDGMLEGEQRIGELVEKAYALLQDKEAPRDGYYAFVCEKCAPGFSYFGYFAAAAELRKEAERIYEGIRAGKSIF